MYVRPCLVPSVATEQTAVIRLFVKRPRVSIVTVLFLFCVLLSVCTCCAVLVLFIHVSTIPFRNSYLPNPFGSNQRERVHV